MPEILPQYMGYDRTIAVFSPDGRLFQVEYAKETVKRGATALGIVYKDGVVLATVKHVSKLMVPSMEKLFKIDEHIGLVAAGFLSDARILANLVRVRAQVHRLTYEEPADVWNIARVLGDRMQLNTLYAGLRPFGVSILIGGYDPTGIHLIESDPSGMLYEWVAYAIGRGATVANKIFKQKWKEGISREEAIRLALDALLKTEKIKSEKGLEIAVLEKGKKFKFLSKEEIKKFLK